MRAQMALDSTAAGIYSLDLQGNCTFCNVACLRLLGYRSVSDLIGKNMHALVHHTRTDGAPCRIEECRNPQAFSAREASHGSDVQLCRSDGTRLPVEFWAVPVLQNGVLIGSVITFIDITERNQTARSIERFRGCLELGLIGVVVTSETRDIIEANDKFCEILGYERDELLRMKWAQLTYPEDLTADLIRFGRAVAGENDPAEKWFIRKDLRAVHGTISVKSVRQGDGSVEFVVGLLQETPERASATKALRESEERLRMAISAARMYTWDWNVKIDQVIRSGHFHDVWGTDCSLSEKGFATFIQVVHPEDREKVKQAIDDALQKILPYRVDFRIIRSDGKVRWVETQGHPYDDGTGKAVRVIGITQDITDRKEFEEELKKALSLHEATLESTADGILVFDLTGKITSYNQRFLQIWRIPESLITTRNNNKVSAFMVDQLKDPAAFLQKAGEIISDPEIESIDLLEFTDGRVIERYSRPQKIGGAPVGRVLSFRDITERKKAAQALEEEAMHDILTGLYNRRYFNHRILQEISWADRNQCSLAILLCDLDYFKKVNDSKGHQTGDEVLQRVARLIQDSTRGTDLVFRWGGDEIVVVLPKATRDGIRVTTTRIRRGVKQISEHIHLPLDLSIGIALYPEHGREVKDLIHVADRALYIAKKGESKVQFGSNDREIG